MLATSAETAKALGICTATLMRHVKNGVIAHERCAKVGNRWRFDLEGIERDLLARDYEPPKNP